MLYPLLHPRALLAQLRQLPAGSRALFTTVCAWQALSVAGGLFAPVMVFLQTQSAGLLLLFLGAKYVINGFAFAGLGEWLLRRRVPVRPVFLWAFCMLAASLLLLAVLPMNIWVVFASGAALGVGNGLFWFGRHSFEIALLQDRQRDMFLSMTTGATGALETLAPAAITAVLAAEILLGAPEFSVTLPLCAALALLGVLAARGLCGEMHLPLAKTNSLAFILSAGGRRWGPFWLAQGLHISGEVMGLLAAAMALGSAVNVGGFEAVFGLLCALFAGLLGGIRNPQNRLLFLWIGAAGMAFGVALLLAIPQIFWGFLAMRLCFLFFGPLEGVSHHAYTLASVNRACPAAPATAMLCREWVLTITRAAMFGLLCAIFLAFGNQAAFVASALCMIVALLIEGFAVQFGMRTREH